VEISLERECWLQGLAQPVDFGSFRVANARYTGLWLTWQGEGLGGLAAGTCELRNTATILVTGMLWARRLSVAFVMREAQLDHFRNCKLLPRC
jgi:hypothetical protein